MEMLRGRGVGWVAIALAACGPSEPWAGAAAMDVDTVGGVAHVSHRGTAPVMEPTLRVAIGETGGLDGASPAEFGRVRSVIGDDSGRIYVADDHAQEIRVFDPDGGFLRAMGRRGGGPGETAGIHGAAWLGSDTMVVVDYGNARLMLMSAAGEYLGQWPWMRATGSIRFFFNGGPGAIYAHGVRPRPDGDGASLEPVWVRYEAGGPTDSLSVPRLTERIPGTGATCRGGDGIGFFSNPHGQRLLTSPAPNAERITALSHAYRLVFLDARGDTARVLTRAAQPVPLEDDVWQETAEQYAEFQRSWRGADCDGQIDRPRNRPVLREVSLDHDGRLLVEINTPDGPALDVFGTDWRLLGTIPLPERDPGVPVFLRGDRLYLATRDALGVQRVEVYDVGAAAARQ